MKTCCVAGNWQGFAADVAGRAAAAECRFCSVWTPLIDCLPAGVIVLPPLALLD